MCPTEEEKMAHELELINGNASMFYRGAKPWHSLGTMIEGEISVEEAIVAAGLDWRVDTQKVYLADGTIAPAKATVRSSDNKILGVVG